MNVKSQINYKTGYIPKPKKEAIWRDVFIARMTPRAKLEEPDKQD
jgi:hypothetical protein